MLPLAINCIQCNRPVSDFVERVPDGRTLVYLYCDQCAERSDLRPKVTLEMGGAIANSGLAGALRLLFRLSDPMFSILCRTFAALGEERYVDTMKLVHSWWRAHQDDSSIPFPGVQCPGKRCKEKIIKPTLRGGRTIIAFTCERHCRQCFIEDGGKLFFQSLTLLYGDPRDDVVFSSLRSLSSALDPETGKLLGRAGDTVKLIVAWGKAEGLSEIQ